MKFPNAAKGVSKIFTAEILGLIATILIGIGTVTAAVAYVGSKEKVISDAAVGGTAVGGGAILTIGAIIAFVGAIIGIVGMVQAGKDEKFFKYALYAMIIYIVVYAIMSFALTTSGYKDYVGSGTTLINLIVTVLIIQGVINIANQKQNEKIAAKGALIFKLIICVTVLEIIVGIIAAATKNQVAAVIAVVLAIVALVLSLVRYILYLSLLSNAKKMLAEDAEPKA